MVTWRKIYLFTPRGGGGCLHENPESEATE